MSTKPAKVKRPSLTKLQKQSRTEDGFYQSYKWIKFRGMLKHKQIEKDLIRARELYERDSTITLHEYHHWLRSGYPLCEASFAKGKIKPANTLDHIKPINQGGSVWDVSNLQWLSEKEHAIKSQKEKS